MSFYIEPRDTLSMVAVDLDDTLAEGVWPKPGIGKPIEKNIKKLEGVVAQGKKPFIYTSRHWSDLEMIRAWIKEYNIPVHPKFVICGKPLVHSFIDDKAINADKDAWNL